MQAAVVGAAHWVHGPTTGHSGWWASIFPPQHCNGQWAIGPLLYNITPPHCSDRNGRCSPFRTLSLLGAVGSGAWVRCNTEACSGLWAPSVQHHTARALGCGSPSVHRHSARGTGQWGTFSTLPHFRGQWAMGIHHYAATRQGSVGIGAPLVLNHAASGRRQWGIAT